MSKTISYYNICLLKDGEKTAANFLDFIDEIAQIDWVNRVRKVEDIVTAFFPMDFSSDPEKRIISDKDQKNLAFSSFNSPF